MPKSLRILCITNCLAWMGHIVYCLYFTDFVGESVFKGDPSADPESLEYEVTSSNFLSSTFFNSIHLFCSSTIKESDLDAWVWQFMPFRVPYIQ